MSSRVVFSLTGHQAAALKSIRAGQGMPGASPRFRARMLTVLVRRGLAEPDLRLTALGEAAAALADKLALRGGGEIDPRQLWLSLGHDGA